MYLEHCLFYCQTTYLMLWSQIKLTSFDYSDVHITGEFDNRPGTGRFLRIFACVVTYSTGARTGIGRFVKRYLKFSGACQTSYDARPGTVGIIRYKF